MHHSIDRIPLLIAVGKERLYISVLDEVMDYLIDMDPLEKKRRKKERMIIKLLYQKNE